MIFSECPGRGAWPRNALGAPQKTRQHKFRIQMQRELELANQFYNGPRRIRGFGFRCGFGFARLICALGAIGRTFWVKTWPSGVRG